MRAGKLAISLLFLFTLVLPGAARTRAAERVRVERGSAEEKAGAVTWTITPDPALPDVLILGDSISIGYTPPLRKDLQGVANVFRPLAAGGQKPANCGDTARGLKSLDAWLEDRTWRVIHFNFGLHDLKYLDAKGAYVTPDKGKQVASVEQYAENLRQIVARVKQTGAILVWGATTPVPDGSLGRVQGSERAYNAAAAKIMRDSGVLVDDLVAALGSRLLTLQRPHNVHFTDEGSQVLADAVAASIRQALKRPWQPPAKRPNGPLQAFTLAAPVEEVIRRSGTYQVAAVDLPHGLVFQSGLVIEIRAAVESANAPTNFRVQIVSRDGKMSTLAVPGAEGKKAVEARVVLPAEPRPHPAARNQAPWKAGDLIGQVRACFVFDTATTSTVRIQSLAVRKP